MATSTGSAILPDPEGSYLEGGWVGAHVHRLRFGTPGQLGEQARNAVLRLDQTDAAPGVLPLQLGADHPGLLAGRRPRPPVHRDHPAAGPWRPDPGQGVERIV